MKKNILLINDLPGYGKVALSAMFPVFSYMGYSVYNLPTALISNTLDYGKFEIMETTDYMENTIKVWEQLGIVFECIVTGFIVSENQAKLVADYVKKQKEQNENLCLIVDPIMGDDGILYNGVSNNIIGYMLDLIRNADIIIPNFTEAAFLTECYAGCRELNKTEIRNLIKQLCSKTDGSIVITSVIEKEAKQHMVYGYDREGRNYFSIPFDYIPVRFPGTGDIFTAILTCMFLDGATLIEAVKTAMNTVESLIQKNVQNEDKYKGIPIEEYLSCLKK